MFTVCWSIFLHVMIIFLSSQKMWCHIIEQAWILTDLKEPFLGAYKLPYLYNPRRKYCLCMKGNIFCGRIRKQNIIKNGNKIKVRWVKQCLSSANSRPNVWLSINEMNLPLSYGTSWGKMLYSKCWHLGKVTLSNEPIQRFFVGKLWLSDGQYLDARQPSNRSSLKLKRCVLLT